MKTLLELWAQSPANPTRQINTSIRKVIEQQRAFIASNPVNIHTTRTQSRILNDSDIQIKAPSVFAQTSWGNTSDRYRFLPTINVVNALRDSGYSVVQALQSRSTVPGKAEFTKHIIRLRHNDYLRPDNVGDELPEIVLVNSHDMTSAYKLMLGIFRLVCTNGLIVASDTIDSINIRHSGQSDLLKNVIDVSVEITKEAPKAFEQIKLFKQIMLTPDDQIAMAKAALGMSTSSIELHPSRLLSYRRYDDRPNPDGTNSLWKTSNIIQENLIKGGVRGTTEAGRSRRTREVKCISGNININRAIWKLSEEMMNHKQK